MPSLTKLDPKLLEILACPACETRPPVKLSDDGSTLDCTVCGRRYPILEDGIPVMIVDQAQPANVPEGIDDASAS